jgi:hypothetical protein
MTSSLSSQLEDILARIEATLKTIDSEHRREKEALDLKHKRKRERLEQAQKWVQQVKVIASENEDSALTEAIREGVGRVDDLSLVEVTSNTAVHTGQQNSTRTGRFSLRREIEKLLPEFEPGQDITQGEVRQRLEVRFPEHTAYLRPATVSSALRRIAKAGSLVQVSEGSGSTPNRYRLPEHSEDNTNQEELSALRE